MFGLFTYTLTHAIAPRSRTNTVFKESALKADSGRKKNQNLSHPRIESGSALCLAFRFDPLSTELYVGTKFHKLSPYQEDFCCCFVKTLSVLELVYTGICLYWNLFTLEHVCTGTCLCWNLSITELVYIGTCLIGHCLYWNLSILDAGTAFS